MDIEGGSSASRQQSPLHRVFCPVASCPCSDVRQAPGWASPQTMTPRINSHLAGSLGGQISESWLNTDGKTTCPVYAGLMVAASRKVHSACRPQLRARTTPADKQQAALPVTGSLPSLQDVFTKKVSVLTRVPMQARNLWAQALTRYLSAAVAQHSVRAWTELMMLPESKLCGAPGAGARSTCKQQMPSPYID